MDPQDQELVVDATRIPELSPEVQLKAMRHPDGREGFIQYDPQNFIIMPIGHIMPIRIPDKRFDRDQPLVGTCSRRKYGPKPGEFENLGCAVYDTCPVRDWAEKMRAMGKGPWTAIIRAPDGEGEDAERCYRLPPHRQGRKVFEEGRLQRGWTLITDKTTVRRTRARKALNPGEDGDREIYQFEEEVKELGPMYAHLTGEQWPKGMHRERPKEKGRSGSGPARKAADAGKSVRRNRPGRKADASIQGKARGAVRVPGQGQGRPRANRNGQQDSGEEQRA